MMSSTNFAKVKMDRNKSSNGFNFLQWQGAESVCNL